MSFLRKLFNIKEDKAVAIQTIQKLRETEELLIKKQEYLESKYDQEIRTAKKNASQNEQPAIQALKRKKRYEKQLQQIDGMLVTIEIQRETMEGAKSNAAILETIETAAEALTPALEYLNLDEVHDKQDDKVGFDDDMDEDELKKELEELMNQTLEEALLVVPQSQDLPAVPTGDIAEPKPAKSKVEHDDEMREL